MVLLRLSGKRSYWKTSDARRWRPHVGVVWCGACVPTPSQERGGLEESDRVNFTLRYIIYSSHTKQAPDSFTESNRLTSSSTPRKRLWSWLQLLSSPTFSSGRCLGAGDCMRGKAFSAAGTWAGEVMNKEGRDVRSSGPALISLLQPWTDHGWERRAGKYQVSESPVVFSIVGGPEPSIFTAHVQSVPCCFLASDDTGGCTHCDVTKSLVVDFVCHPQVARGFQTSSMLSVSDHCHVIHARFYAMGHPGSQWLSRGHTETIAVSDNCLTDRKLASWKLWHACPFDVYKRCFPISI